jgi:hypothetical protein
MYHNSDSAFAFVQFFYGKLLNDICAPAPADLVTFHTSWIFQGDPSEDLLSKIRIALRSFFTFHNSPSPRLVLWTNDVAKATTHLPDMASFMEIRKYNVTNESKGTPLEGKMKEANLKKNDENNLLQSGLLRLIVLYKYGGLYFDMDNVFFRNVLPLCNIQFAYKYGAQERLGDAVLSLRGHGALATAILEKVVELQDTPAPEGAEEGWSWVLTFFMDHPDMHVLPGSWFEPFLLEEQEADLGNGIFATTNLAGAFNPAQGGKISANYMLNTYGYMLHWHGDTGDHWTSAFPAGSPMAQLQEWFANKWPAILPLLASRP